MSNVVASTVSHVLGAVGGAGSKDMGCAPVARDPGERRQMEAVESLIGDGGGDWGGVWFGAWQQRAGGWSSKGSRREAREWWCFLLAGLAGSWVWELLAGCSAAHTIWSEHSASGDRGKGARERGREGSEGGREDEKEFEFGRAPHSTVAHDRRWRKRWSTRQDKTDKKDKTSRGRDWVQSSNYYSKTSTRHTPGQQQVRNYWTRPTERSLTFRGRRRRHRRGAALQLTAACRNLLRAKRSKRSDTSSLSQMPANQRGASASPSCTYTPPSPLLLRMVSSLLLLVLLALLSPLSPSHSTPSSGCCWSICIHGPVVHPPPRKPHSHSHSH
jgi:hypothetical protein